MKKIVLEVIYTTLLIVMLVLCMLAPFKWVMAVLLIAMAVIFYYAIEHYSGRVMPYERDVYSSDDVPISINSYQSVDVIAICDAGYMHILYYDFKKHKWINVCDGAEIVFDFSWMYKPEYLKYYYDF